MSLAVFSRIMALKEGARALGHRPGGDAQGGRVRSQSGEGWRLSEPRKGHI